MTIFSISPVRCQGGLEFQHRSRIADGSADQGRPDAGVHDNVHNDPTVRSHWVLLCNSLATRRGTEYCDDKFLGGH